MSSEIQVFDFFLHKFSGDQRQAHQFIPYVYGKLSAKGIQWILNESKHPTPMINPLTIIAARADEHMQENVSLAFRSAFQQYGIDLAVWEQERIIITKNPDNLMNQQKLEDELENHHQYMPKEPVLIMPDEKDFKCRPSDHVKMDKISEKKLKFISIAAEAIQVVLEYISVDMKTSLADLLGNQDIDERTKLINIWEWLETFRVDNSSIVGEVQQDMHNLSQIDTFAEAMLRIKDMNILQHELKVMKQPYSDRELIVIHAGKLRGDVFKEVNYKWLQQSTRPTHSKPSLSRTTQPVASIQSQVQWSWDDYCDDISRYNNTDNTVRTKSTVLLAKNDPPKVYSTTSEEDIEARVLALYNQRYGPSSPFNQSSGFIHRQKSYGRSGQSGTRPGRWQHQRSQSQFPQSNSPYTSQYMDPEDHKYKSQVPAQSPFRSQIPQSATKPDPRFNTRPPLPSRPEFQHHHAGHNEKRKRYDSQSSPSKRAYTSYVEDFNMNAGDSPNLQRQSYEDFVCDNALAFSVKTPTTDDEPEGHSSIS